MQPFQLERFFAKYEFTTKYLLCVSDCEALSMQELVDMADEDSQQRWHNLTLGYTESQGHPLLRQEIVKAMYPSLQADQTVVLAPEEGIYLTMHALLQPSDHVVSISPGYQSLHEVARSIGCDVSFWRIRDIPDHPNHAQMFCLDDLEALVQPNTKVVIINFPHNPTGIHLTRAELDRIIAYCRRRGIYLFSDEMYRLLEHDPATTRLPPACELYEKAISLGGMSKAFGLPGLRIGWIASQDSQLVTKVLEYKDYTTICSSAPSEILALMALRARDRILERNMEIIRQGLHAVTAFMQQYRHLFAFEPPTAGPIAFAKVLKPHTTASAYCDALVKDAGILLLPSGLYDVEDVRVRISFGRTNTPEILQVWHNHLSKTS